MSVKIRLRRMGRKKQPHYRVVVADSASPRDGRFVESLGYYKPLNHPARLVVDLERVDYWISQGALPSDTVKSLISKARKGGDETIAVGEPDVEAEKARRAEALAAKRKGDKEAGTEKAKASAAEAEAAPAEAKPEVEEAPASEDVAEAPSAEAELEAPPEPEPAPEPEASTESEASSAEAEAAPGAKAETEAVEAGAEEGEEGADEPDAKTKED